MKFKSLFLLVIFLLPTSFISSVSGEPQSSEQNTVVDYVFSNGNIISVDENMTVYEAIAIDDGVIVALGSTSEITNTYRMLDFDYYDLEERTMMPGIIDGHTHYMASYYWAALPDTIHDIQEVALAHGYTTLNEKSIDINELAELQNAEMNDDLRLRLNLFPIFNYASLNETNQTTLVRRWYPTNDPILDHERMLRIPGIKIFADGYSGQRGYPALSVPWPQDLVDLIGIPRPMGDLYLNQSLMNETVKTIHDKGYSVAFHAMGDRTIDTILNAIEYAVDGETNVNYRHQIEHNSFFRENQTQKALNLDMIHSIRGYFPTYKQDDYETHYPGWLNEWHVNRYSLPGAGLHCYLETDFSIGNYNSSHLHRSANIRPFFHLWGLVTRQAFDENGTIHYPYPWLAEHAISVEQGLRMLTYEGAYAVKQENYLGTLEVGKFADVIILSDDPLTINPNDMYLIETYLTMVGGIVEYKRNGYTLTKRNISGNPIIPGYETIILIGLLFGFTFYFILRYKLKNEYKDKL